ncbi:uncharacterized protein [Narcine bancroftii]|uniref:uncharacterized protein isoform X1 n=1 Tax=Narcine bancroftii TaxID=1343680 RepID=UPI0038318F03
MGCGGSRADTIEPRYLESWTRETESTWLTNTDTEAPVVAGAEPRASDNGPDTSEGSTQTHTRVTLCSTGKEKMSTIKRTSTVGTNTHRGKQQLTHVPGATLQKGHIFLTYEKPANSERDSLHGLCLECQMLLPACPSLWGLNLSKTPILLVKVHSPCFGREL